MPDNIPITPGSGATVAADELSYGGDPAVKLQIIRLAHIVGAEGSKTLHEVFTQPGSPSTYALTIQEPLISAHHFVAAATANAASVKASAGVVKGFSLFNASDVPIYLKFHNTAGAPTPGSGVVRTFGIQAGTQRDVRIPGGGLSLGTGIGITVVRDLADAGTTATAANDAVGEIFYA